MTESITMQNKLVALSLLHPFGVRISFSTLSGGLRFASTTRYYLRALRAQPLIATYRFGNPNDKS